MVESKAFCFILISTRLSLREVENFFKKNKNHSCAKCVFNNRLQLLETKYICRVVTLSELSPKKLFTGVSIMIFNFR